MLGQNRENDKFAPIELIGTIAPVTTVGDTNIIITQQEREHT